MEFETNFKKSKEEKVCQMCKGAKIVKEKDGSIHVCYDCLREGRLDVHSKNLPDSGIKV